MTISLLTAKPIAPVELVDIVQSHLSQGRTVVLGNGDRDFFSTVLQNLPLAVTADEIQRGRWTVELATETDGRLLIHDHFVRGNESTVPTRFDTCAEWDRLQRRWDVWRWASSRTAVTHADGDTITTTHADLECVYRTPRTRKNIQR